MSKKVNLFYIVDYANSKAFIVKHRQISGNDRDCATFYYNWTVSRTRALKAAKVFCKQMNTYYPDKVSIK